MKFRIFEIHPRAESVSVLHVDLLLAHSSYSWVISSALEYFVNLARLGMANGQKYRPSYHTFVQSLILSGYSNLKYLDRDILDDRFNFEATCTVLLFGNSGEISEPKTACEADFVSTPADIQGRLFILQGEPSRLVNQLGKGLDIEPEFLQTIYMQ